MLAGSVPAARTPLVGRRADLEALDSGLQTSRVLTVTGPGGVGKTRLALEFARSQERRYDGGVCFVNLAPLDDPDFVPGALLAALGAREEGERPLRETLASRLGDARMLVVLDNCEHLVASAAAVADAVLDACPNVRVLATSRERLGVAGEAVHRVPVLGDEDGAQLFADRARALVPGFAPSAGNLTTVKRICARVDGLPLAIELAASRIATMTPEQLWQRLDDRLGLLTRGNRTALTRQQTLRDTIAWSYHLLDDREQTMLRRLAVFAGEFTADAAAALDRSDTLANAATLDLLANLIDKSLVQSDGSLRYRLLESTKEFALERLREAGEAGAMRRLHAQYFARLAAESDAMADTPEYSELVWQIARDYAEFRAALGWALGEGNDVALGAAVAASLGRYWYERGASQEGRRWLERALESADGLPAHVRARALLHLGSMCYAEGDYAPIGDLALRAEAAYGEDGDALGQAKARNLQATVALNDGRFEEAYAIYQSVLDAATAIGNARLEDIALLNMANTLMSWKGDYVNAEPLYARSVALCRRMGIARALALALTSWGESAADAGEYERAEALSTEGLAIFRRIGDDRSVLEVLVAFAPQRAWAGAYDAAAESLREAVDRLRDAPHRIYGLECVEACGFLAAGTRDRATAATLFGCAQAQRAALGVARSAPRQKRYEAAVESARESLGDAAFASAIGAGQALSSNDALNLCEQLLSRFSAPSATPTGERIVVDVASGEVTKGGHSMRVSSGTLALLTMLGVHARAVPNETVMDALWPDLDGDAAANALKACVRRARTQLGDPDAIVVSGGTCALGKHVTSTFAGILALAESANADLSESEIAAVAGACERLARGAASWDRWEWFAPYARKLFDAFAALGELLWCHEVARDESDAAARIARALVAAAPFAEKPRWLLIQTYLQAGNRAMAQAELEAFSELLQRATGERPSEALRRLVAG